MRFDQVLFPLPTASPYKTHDTISLTPASLFSTHMNVKFLAPSQSPSVSALLLHVRDQTAPSQLPFPDHSIYLNFYKFLTFQFLTVPYLQHRQLPFRVCRSV
jgi:hypothetical protein